MAFLHLTGQGTIETIRSPTLAINGHIDCIAKFCDAVNMRYPGGKGRCYRQIIAQMPAHQTYIELSVVR